MVVAAKEDVCGRLDRLTGRLRAAALSRVARLRAGVHRLAARPGLAGWPARLALRGRHAAELTYDLRRAARAVLARADRRYRGARLKLETQDLRRRLERISARLARAETALGGAARRMHARADARLGTLAGRLETLSPLAVLGRGYAVCWRHDRSAIVRDAETVAPGDQVRVTLERGELECVVERTNDHEGQGQE
jgi:exodeoxyribonuclease VII large subunit